MKLFSAILAFFCAACVPALAVTPQQLAALEHRALGGDAEAGDADKAKKAAKALYMLGQIYESGDGVPADKNIATCYYRAAAHFGDEAAKVKLGIAVPAPAATPGASAPAAASDAGKTLSVDCGNGVKMELLRIPAGTFTMGSPESEEGRYSDEKQVRVNITKPFFLGKTEVTQAQYQAVVGSNPSRFKGANLPVENVSWDDATAFCEKLTSRARAAGTLPSGWKFTLPTEAQWEYACRAGTTTRFSFGNADSDLRLYGNFGDRSLRASDSGYSWLDDVPWNDGYAETTAPVGSFRPNAWGLYDMHGNVWEWCLDYYNSELSGGNDPCRTTPGSGDFGSRRVYRGGSWGGRRSVLPLGVPRLRCAGQPQQHFGLSRFRSSGMKSVNL